MNEWIDIKEQLPHIFPVEVCHMKYKYKFTTKGIDENNHAPNGPWFNTDIPGMSMNATHWMPLPDPPDNN